MNYAQQIYASLREYGLSAQQARIMTAEIGRENSFNPNFLFGSHADPKKWRNKCWTDFLAGNSGEKANCGINSKGFI